MNAIFINWSKGENLENCIFDLRKNIGGFYSLDGIYTGINSHSEQHFTYNEVIKMNNFSIRNKNKVNKISRYKNPAAFLKRIKDELEIN